MTSLISKINSKSTELLTKLSKPLSLVFGLIVLYTVISPVIYRYMPDMPRFDLYGQTSIDDPRSIEQIISFFTGLISVLLAGLFNYAYRPDIFKWHRNDIDERQKLVSAKVYTLSYVVTFWSIAVWAILYGIFLSDPANSRPTAEFFGRFLWLYVGVPSAIAVWQKNA